MGDIIGTVNQRLVGVAILFDQDLLKDYLTSCCVLVIAFKIDQSHQKDQAALEALCKVFVCLEIFVTI